MTYESSVQADATLGVAMVDAADDLTVIRQPDCMAAVWVREPTHQFQTWIDTLPIQQLPSARVTMRPESARRVARDLLASAGVPHCDEANVLADDIAALTHIFAALMDTPFVRLRLEPVTGDACRRFHMDAVTARLICTYRGPGTQYGLAPHHGASGDPANIFAAPTGAPMLLCGSEWPGGVPEPRLLHRSPPIEASRQSRFVLVLDPVSSEDAAA